MVSTRSPHSMPVCKAEWEHMADVFRALPLRLGVPHRMPEYLNPLNQTENLLVPPMRCGALFEGAGFARGSHTDLRVAVAAS